MATLRARLGGRAEDLEVYPSAAAGGGAADYTVEIIQENVLGAWLTGRYTRVANPRTAFSVLEPVRGCGTLAQTSETAVANGCAVGVNAGFFDTGTFDCIGHVVSDGRVVQADLGSVNAHFGVRASDSAFVTGYFDPATVGAYTQLVGGVGWLVRNGALFVNESAALEGIDRNFVDLLSARSAIGHDAEGRLIHVEFDGKTDERGIDLTEFAILLRDKYDLVNAINLDGGGSVTHVTNGIITSNPS